jgi:TetR/AcrR family tetracycline transcriptional repressor
MALSRSDVIGGALRLLDDEGLDALTMRRLAQRLGVRAGAIYWHFADKQDLIDALSEALMDGLLEPAPTGRWDARLAVLARRIMKALTRHRDAARLATLALRPGPNGLALSEALLAIVREAGFSRRDTLWASSVLGYFLLGYATDVQATEAAKRRGLKTVIRSLDKTLDAMRYPRLHELARRDGIAAMMSTREFEARFEFGLQLILSGLRALKPRRQPALRGSAGPRRRRREAR